MKYVRIEVYGDETAVFEVLPENVEYERRTGTAIFEVPDSLWERWVAHNDDRLMWSRIWDAFDTRAGLRRLSEEVLELRTVNRSLRAQLDAFEKEKKP